MTEWTGPLATLEDLPSSGAMHVVISDGTEVLLCRHADTVYALDNQCTHAAARLCEGRLRGGRVFCPLHGAAFDIRTGEALSRPASVSLPRYDVDLREDGIYLRMGVAH